MGAYKMKEVRERMQVRGDGGLNQGSRLEVW